MPHGSSEQSPTPPLALHTGEDTGEHTGEQSCAGRTHAGCASRRAVLRAGTGVLAGVAAVSALAACGGGEGGTTDAATAGNGSTGGGTSTGGAAGRVAALSDIPVGGAIAVSANGQALLVAQPTQGSVVAFSSKCPHQGCSVGVGDGKFACPCHGAEYELATGAITKDPDPAGNTSDLTKVSVTVQGTDVVTA